MARTAMYTDQYELTMLSAALADGSADRRCTFEVFGRRLPERRRFGVVGGTGRFLAALADFRFDDDELRSLQREGIVDARCADFLRSYRFTGDIEGYAEGEPYFPNSPLLTVTSTFAEAVVLETLALSILNHDSAIAAAAARMAIAAGDRPLIEMGSRRTHESAAVAAARVAYLVGFAATSNLAAGEQYGIPTAGTAAHAFVLLHDSETAAFTAQVAQLGVDTTLLVDTYDTRRGIQTAVEVAGTSLGAVRIDSGDLGVIARQARELLDSLGATSTRIVVSGDLDEFAIAALAAAPVDVYGVGTSVVVGSGVPTAGLVYKLVEVDGRPVAKRSEHKRSAGGRKRAYRRHRESGTATEELVVLDGSGFEPGPRDRLLTVPLVQKGETVAEFDLAEARSQHRRAVTALPWEAVKLSRGEPGLPVTMS
jgi:nicotinate phosphoribosyltransferase